MLVKLLPDQVSEHWDEIRLAIEKALPPIMLKSDRAMVNILKSILSDYMQCWVMWVNKDSEAEIRAILTTTIEIDRVCEMKYLLIYSFYTIKPLLPELAVSTIDTLKKFARGRGCQKLVAYTNIPRMEQLWESLGGTTEMKLLEIVI